MPSIYEMIQHASHDAIYATPAALFRVLLEFRVQPQIRWYFRVGTKLRIFLLSISAGIVVGQWARAWPKSTEFISLPILIICASLLAQELGMQGLPRLKRWLSTILRDKR